MRSAPGETEVVMGLVQVLAIVGSVAFLGLIVELVRRRALAAEYSLVWLICGLALLILSIWKRVLDAIAAWVGVFYPPTLLLLVLVGFVCVGSLLFTVSLSRHRMQIERLTEELGILSARLRELRQKEQEQREPRA
jgi:hypothetical protein